ncbi:MAG: glycosyltransferase family 2 protein [Pseudomonadota bacterium]
MSVRVYVVTAVSNEAPFLLEWVAHHRAMGFAGAILFTYDSTDGTDAMVARLAEMGHAHAVPMKVKKSKDPMRQAMRDLPDIAQEIGADWCLVAHIDEYLQITAGDGMVIDLIEACGSPDAISVSRRAFGSSGHRGIPQGQLRETHRLAAPTKAQGHMVAKGIKTLFRVDRITRVAPHRPYFPEGKDPHWVDAGGQPMPAKYLEGKWTAHKDFANTHARLHYYAVPTPEVAMIRSGVPRNAAKQKAFEANWRKLDINETADNSMGRAVGLSDPFVAEFNTDETLRNLQEAGRAWYAGQAADLLADDKVKTLCDQLSGTKDAQSQGTLRSSPRGGGGKYLPPPVRPIRFKVKPAKSGKTRAVLHGGFHKTATTFLQRLLEDNDAWLGSQSVYVVPHLKLRKHITFPSQLDAYRKLKIWRRTRFSEDELQEFQDAFFKDPLKARPARMILSDENLPGLPAHCVTTGKLYQHRRAFFEAFARRMPLPITDAFFAVRNYADFFASSYVEYLRAATPTTSGFMDTPEMMRRNVFGSLPNWSRVFDDFEAAFPGVRIHVWRFEDFRALTPQILQAFCGEGVDVSKFKPPKERNARPSASARAVGELVLTSELEGAGAMAERAKSVQDMYPQGDDYERYDPWTAQERAHLTALYDRDWQALCADERFVTLVPEGQKRTKRA